MNYDLENVCAIQTVSWCKNFVYCSIVLWAGWPSFELLIKLAAAVWCSILYVRIGEIAFGFFMFQGGFIVIVMANKDFSTHHITQQLGIQPYHFSFVSTFRLTAFSRSFMSSTKILKLKLSHVFWYPSTFRIECFCPPKLFSPDSKTFGCITFWWYGS